MYDAHVISKLVLYDSDFSSPNKLFEEFKWVSPRGWRSNDDECFSLSKEWTTSIIRITWHFKSVLERDYWRMYLLVLDRMSITIAPSLLEVLFTSGRIQFDKFA